MGINETGDYETTPLPLGVVVLITFYVHEHAKAAQ